LDEMMTAMGASFDELDHAAASGGAVRGSLVLDDMCERFALALRALIPADLVHFTLLVDDKTQRWGRDESGGDAPVELVEDVLARGEAHGDGARVMNDLEFQLATRPSSDGLRLMLALGMRSSLSVSLSHLGRPLGVLRVAARQAHAYTPDQAAQLVEVRDSLAAVLDRAMWIGRVVEARSQGEQVRRTLLPERLAQLQPPPEAGFASWHAAVSVVVANLVDFSAAGGGGAWNLVGVLSEIFERFDEACALNGVERIKSVGDLYLAVAGLDGESADHALRAVQASRAMVEIVDQIAKKHQLPIRVQVGVATGPGVSGIVGGRRISFDVWGEAVSLAGKLEAHGIPGRVQLCEKTARGIAGRFLMESRGVVRLSGVGAVRAWLLSA